MNTQSLFRYGGIAAIVSVITFIIVLVLIGMTGNSTSSLVMAAYAITTLTSLVTFYALYVIHRTEAATLSLAALVTVVLSSLLSFGADYNNPSSPLMLGITILYALGGLLYGWLGYRSPRQLRAGGITALIVGGLAALAAIFAAIGSIELADTVLMIANLVWIVWFLLLARYFLAEKQVAPSAAL